MRRSELPLVPRKLDELGVFRVEVEHGGGGRTVFYEELLGDPLVYPSTLWQRLLIRNAMEYGFIFSVRAVGQKLVFWGKEKCMRIKRCTSLEKSANLKEVKRGGRLAKGCN